MLSPLLLSLATVLSLAPYQPLRLAARRTAPHHAIEDSPKPERTNRLERRQQELSQRHPRALYVTLNRETARRRGIADGDEIELVGVNGYSAGRGLGPR